MVTENDIAPPPSPVMVNKTNLLAIQRDIDTDTLTTNTICKMFDEFLVEFEKMEKTGVTTQIFLNAVEEIADAVLGILPYKLLDPKILSHPLVQFLHQMLIDLLYNWRASRLRLNIQESDIFLKIVLIFVHAAEQAPTSSAEDDRIRIRDLIATRKFLHLVREQIVDNITNKEGINDDPNICTLGLLTIKLLQGSPFYYSEEQNQRLIDDLIINCLDSYDYLHALRQLQQGENLTDVERYLLYNCWEHIPLVSANTRTASKGSNSIQFVQDFYDTLLTRLEHALNEPPPVAPSSYAYIFERCTQLLTIRNLPSFDKHAPIIIDHLSHILQNESPTNNNQDEMIITALQVFHNLTNNIDFRAIMKKKHLTPLFNQYITTDEGQKRKLAFSILAEIMDEQDINNNPSDITSYFINQLKYLNPNSYDPSLDTALTGLKALMPHEQVKNEFVKQGGLEPLIRFINNLDPSKQSDKQTEDVLTILWSCAMSNPQALNELQQDTKLMYRVDQLLQNAKNNENTSLEKAAEGLIWKVEKEEQFKQQQAQEAERKQQEKKQKAQQSGAQQDEEEEEEEEQYDCMISYSWADMDLAHRIFHHLTEKLGYKIWLDQEQMHGSTIQAMANAVENAQFILMCMSETYKRSANCQSEAEYAFNRKKHIVPIKMKKDFTPDGWLGFILGTRMYIDFGTYDFDKAIGLLQNEIELQKKKRKEAKDLAKAVKQATQHAENPTDDKEEKANREVVTNTKMNMEKIRSWTETNVRDFLLKNNLPAMVPLCDGINGEELSNLYGMCKTNATSMYRSLKFELLHGYNRILPISTYLRFVSRMRVLCDDGLSSGVSNGKKCHDSSFVDDE